MVSWTITEPQRVDIGIDVGADAARAIRQLQVRLNAGHLTVVGTDGPPRVEISRMAAAPIKVTLEDGCISVVHEGVKTWPGILVPLWWFAFGRRYECDVSIAVPYETLTRLWLASGSVTASGLQADVTADCVSGRVTLFGIAGALRAKVVSGPIEVLGCAGSVELETVSGEIVLADTASGDVHAKTVSGSVTADLDNPPDRCDIKLETISGEITIRVREDSDLSVTLSAAHGRVTSEFPGLAGRGAWGSSTAGAIGRPGAAAGHLVATAVGGNIALLRRPMDADFEMDFEADDGRAADGGAGQAGGSGR
jgi:Putative adhesin